MTALPFILTMIVGSLPPQNSVCIHVRAGDTAASLAVRVTGKADNRWQPWFQIFDPGVSRIIPKADYSRILPGWQACVPREILGNRLVMRVAPKQPTEATLPLAGLDPASVSVVAGLMLIAMLGWSAAEEYFRERDAALALMSRFGSRFVREFDRPLPRGRSGDRPVHSRLRCHPRRARFDILLAPGDGHQYPNLTDHRKNLEYDIERVLRLMKEEAVVSGQLHSQGRWVVIPFQLAAGSSETPKQAQRTIKAGVA
jgi:hypothetical protein